MIAPLVGAWRSKDGLRIGRYRIGTSLGFGVLAVLGVAAGMLAAWADGPAQGTPPAGEMLEVKGTEVIGTLKGAVSVGAAGDAHWSTSLKVVPGVGGMEPSLSIEYGGGGYGGLGVGFSLSAGGEISRCRQTLGQDGRHAPVSWTQADPLCLNGA
ncbi:hypothetical protein M2650_16350, partial [Luteimonas sp. SX5]